MTDAMIESTFSQTASPRIFGITIFSDSAVRGVLGWASIESYRKPTSTVRPSWIFPHASRIRSATESSPGR